MIFHQPARLLVAIALISACNNGLAAGAPCDSGPYRAFDFWLGAWQVHTPEGALAGHNQITAEEQGCLLVERWESVRGGTGQSYNYYDPHSQEWHQLWVSAGAIIDYAGGLEGKDMVLNGTITNRAAGTRAPFRGRWSPAEDGSVLQHFEQWNKAEQRWDDWFTGRYTRPASSRAP